MIYIGRLPEQIVQIWWQCVSYPGFGSLLLRGHFPKVFKSHCSVVGFHYNVWKGSLKLRVILETFEVWVKKEIRIV